MLLLAASTGRRKNSSGHPLVIFAVHRANRCGRCKGAFSNFSRCTDYHGPHAAQDADRQEHNGILIVATSSTLLMNRQAMPVSNPHVRRGLEFTLPMVQTLEVSDKSHRPSTSLNILTLLSGRLLHNSSALDLEVDHNDDGRHQQANDAKHDDFVGHDAAGHAGQDPTRLCDVVISSMEGVPCMRDRLPLRMQVLQDAGPNLLQHSDMQ